MTAVEKRRGDWRAADDLTADRRTGVVRERKDILMVWDLRLSMSVEVAWEGGNWF